MSPGVNQQVSQKMSAAERVSEASGAEPAKEWAVRANERMAQYTLRVDFLAIPRNVRGKEKREEKVILKTNNSR